MKTLDELATVITLVAHALLEAADQLHRYHLMSRVSSEHKVLDEYYKWAADAADTFTEQAIALLPRDSVDVFTRIAEPIILPQPDALSYGESLVSTITLAASEFEVQEPVLYATLTDLLGGAVALNYQLRQCDSTLFN